MKLPKFIKKLFGSSAMQKIVDVVITEAHKAVALLMTLPNAKAIKDDILTIANDNLPGQQKFDVVLGRTLPVLTGLLKDKGLTVAIGEIEDIARAFVQAVYNETARPVPPALRGRSSRCSASSKRHRPGRPRRRRHGFRHQPCGVRVLVDRPTASTCCSTSQSGMIRPRARRSAGGRDMRGG